MYVNITYRWVEVSNKTSKVDGIHTKYILLFMLVLYLAACHSSEAASTVASAPEDGCKKRLKHVELYCSYK